MNTKTPDKKPCQFCGKTLVPIGTARSNGSRRFNDWLTREYHKKCWLVQKQCGFDKQINL